MELGLTELVYCGLMAACATGVLGAPGALGRLGSLRLGMGAPLGDACCSLGVTSSMETLHDEFGPQMCRDTSFVYRATRQFDRCMRILPEDAQHSSVAELALGNLGAWGTVKRRINSQQASVSSRLAFWELKTQPPESDV